MKATKPVIGIVVLSVCISCTVMITGAWAFKAVYVSPLPGDTASANGTALISALNGITDASPALPYRLYLGPGIYDLGSSVLQMKEYVSIVGSGEDGTIIQGNVSTLSGVVNGANNAELQYLTVKNNAWGTYAIAIANVSVSPKITNVKVIASGGSGSYSCGVLNYFSAPFLTDVNVTSSGGSNSYSYGVLNYYSSSFLTNVTIASSGGTGSYSYGVLNYSSSPTMANVAVKASGDYYNYGIYNYFSSPTMISVDADAFGGANSIFACGMCDYSSSPSMINVTIGAGGSAAIEGYLVIPTMPLPTGQQFFDIGTQSQPFFSEDPSQARPIGVGSVAANSSTVNILIDLDIFQGPVDAYFVLIAPAIDPTNIYLLTPTGFRALQTAGFAPWMSGITGGATLPVATNIPVSLLPKGTYTLLLVVTPAGSISTYYIWRTSFTIR